MLGIDCDPVCSQNLAENRSANPSKALVHFCIGTIDIIKPAEYFDCVVMNMISKDALPLLGRIGSLIINDGYLVWSGLLLEEGNILLSKHRDTAFICIIMIVKMNGGAPF